MSSSSAKFVGVDGCKAGWFSVDLDGDGGVGFGVFRTLRRLQEHYLGAVLILVDIPIGLSEGGPEERVCDAISRRLIRPRGSSVFRAPTRQAVYESSYRMASDTNAALTGKKLSQQSWGIAPKIREMDELLRHPSSPPETPIREVHPEVCFWALNAKRPLNHGKKKPEGIRERVGVLRRIEPRAREMLREALESHGRHAAPDDVLDALAAAVTAREGYPDKLQTVPENPQKDAHGLPMEMVFYNPNP